MTSKSSIGKEISKCKICGDIVKLSTEHIPPRAALNNKPIKLLKPGESIKLLTRKKLPWDQNDLEYEIKQKGMTLESLCIKCNNFTGRKYGNSYKDFVLSISDIILMKKVKPKDNIKIEYERFEHLKVLKQIMSMFSSMSNICERYSDIKTFILEEQSNVFPEKHVRVYMNMYLGGQDGLFGPIVTGTNNGSILSYQIKKYPIILTLVCDYQSSKHLNINFGYNLTKFHTYKLNQNAPQTFYLSAIESHTFLPTENRTKEQILKSWSYGD